MYARTHARTHTAARTHTHGFSTCCVARSHGKVAPTKSTRGREREGERERARERERERERENVAPSARPAISRRGEARGGRKREETEERKDETSDTERLLRGWNDGRLRLGPFLEQLAISGRVRSRLGFVTPLISGRY
jgi:hypothetical protein